MTPTTRVLIVGGEASGDLYGGLLMRAIAAQGTTRFTGVGGPAMRAAGLESLGDAGAVGVTGILEVVFALPQIWRAFGRAAAVLTGPRERPDLALLIDYPDFNLRLAERARRAGVPVLYFISPQVWAWRPGRIRRIARVVDHMAVVLPFEEEIYRQAGVPATFVGHPLLDLARAGRTREQTLRPLGLDPRRPTVALLPGSRRNELLSHLLPLRDAARILASEFRDVQFLIPVAPTVERAFLETLIRGALPEREWKGERPGSARRPVLVEEGRYDAIAAADAAAVASGTATLETALLGVPMVVVYRMRPLTYAMARRVSRVAHIGMPNLICGERIVPELVQANASPERIASDLRRILTDPARAAAMRDGLRRVRARLGAPGAIERVARIAWSMIAPRQGAAGDAAAVAERV